MVVALVNTLMEYPEVNQIIVTRNIPEDSTFQMLPEGCLTDNPSPQGFAANHNAASSSCLSPYFCVLNPDIELTENPFPALLACFTDPDVAIAAPLVKSPAGETEDSVRHFPTVTGLLRKALGGDDGRYMQTSGDAPHPVDWAAGMFMLFRTKDFKAIAGFDQGFFLYYEDVDICTRLWQAGRRVLACPKTQVIHHARRASRKNFRHMRWHAQSMMRYFWKHWGRLPRRVVG